MKFNGKTVLAKPNGDTTDIINALLNISNQAVQQVKPYISKLIKLTGQPLQDAQLIANFIRSNITYKADGYNNQNIQLPARLLYDTKIGDCKSFSLLFYALMQASGHNAGYRFASYKKNKIPTHVYNYVKDNGKIYTFDTCVRSLRESPRYTYIQDMNVNYLTGIDDDYLSGKAERKAKRDKRKAEGKGLFAKVKKVGLSVPRTAFRTLVSINVRGLATKLNKAIAKDPAKLKSLWERFGGKFDKLEKSINTGKNKKPLFGAKVSGYYDENNNYIGVVTPETAALIASASALLVPISKLLKDLGIQKEPGEEGTEDIITPDEEKELEASGAKLEPGFIATDDENKNLTTAGGFSPSPLLIGGVIGAGLLIYLLTKKKK